MMKLGYKIRMTASVGLLGAGILLGLDALENVLVLELLSGLLIFGIGCVLATFSEMKRLEGLA